MMKDDCIFCKLANGMIPTNTIYEDEIVRVVLDMGLASRGHALILPKGHYDDVCSLDEKTAARILPVGAKVGQAMKAALGAAGFNLVQNNGRAAGQTVFHFHMHVIPRYEDGPAMISWVPGEPSAKELEDTAKMLQDALREA